MKRVITIVAAAAVLAPATASAQSDKQDVHVRSVVRMQQTQAQRERIRQQQERARAAREAEARRRYPEEQSEKISRTLSIGNSGELDLSNLSGDIVITRGGGNVQVEAVKIAHGRTVQDAREALGRVTVEFSERGSRAEVRAVYPRHDQRARGTQNVNVSVQYTVMAPENTRISARSLSGNIRVSGIRGNLNVESLSGDLVIDDAARVVAASSTSGNVEITNLRSEMGLEVNTISGDLTVRQSTAPRMELGTVSGRLTITDVRCERLEAQTLNGDLEVTTPLQKNGRYELGSHTGVIRFIPTGNVGFDLEADSFSGDIQSALTLTNVRQGGADYGRRTPRGRTRSLEGTYGDGSATLEITTFSGTVIIGKK
jgi:DUF4097 and DUF4098 domain-containing protein YvlB